MQPETHAAFPNAAGASLVRPPQDDRSGCAGLISLFTFSNQTVMDSLGSLCGNVCLLFTRFHIKSEAFCEAQPAAKPAASPATLSVDAQAETAISPF